VLGALFTSGGFSGMLRTLLTFPVAPRNRLRASALTPSARASCLPPSSHLTLLLTGRSFGFSVIALTASIPYLKRVASVLRRSRGDERLRNFLPWGFRRLRSDLPRLKFLPVSQKEPQARLAPGELLPQLRFLTGRHVQRRIRSGPNPIRVGLFPARLKLTFVYAAI
jgi:hypothetical protein